MTHPSERMSEAEIEWADVDGFDGYYKVSNRGEIVSLQRVVMRSNGCPQTIDQRTLSQITDKYGYLTVRLWKNKKCTNRKVHQVVAQAFIPNPESKRQINHKDGDKTNNTVSNLEWSTPAENTSHAYRTGLACMSGESNHQSKLSELAARIVLKLSDMGSMSHREIGNAFGVSQSLISGIASGNYWKGVKR